MPWDWSKNIQYIHFVYSKPFKEGLWIVNINKQIEWNKTIIPEKKIYIEFHPLLVNKKILLFCSINMPGCQSMYVYMWNACMTGSVQCNITKEFNAIIKAHYSHAHCPVHIFRWCKLNGSLSVENIDVSVVL